jgi:DNA invertase Pin-like site-specific DNA recombinase
MLTVLGGLAEFERELIRARTGEGRARAKAAGQEHGAARTSSPRTSGRKHARGRAAGETLVSIARSYNVHHATIGRLCVDEERTMVTR